VRKTLNIIGCGKVGKVLGRLWTAHQCFEVQDVLTRSPDSARRAVEFIGAGRPLDDYAALRPADVCLVGVPDDRIADCARQLFEAGGLHPGGVAFHCSGALPSTILHRDGVAAASVHPIRSFADPEQVARDFAGTWGGIEGETPAVEVLKDAFTAIGARTVAIDAGFKSVYHAAAVFASNYLVTLLDTAVESYARAGIPREVALELMEPLVRGTVDNVFRLGTTEALTGPIARGDVATTVRQYRAVRAWDKQRGDLYKRLGKLTAVIAARRKT
jgi:predicted short-subunit dehydrogenase-like oxidoreductase (DUF2520 family)